MRSIDPPASSTLRVRPDTRPPQLRDERPHGRHGRLVRLSSTSVYSPRILGSSSICAQAIRLTRNSAGPR